MEGSPVLDRPSVMFVGAFRLDSTPPCTASLPTCVAYQAPYQGKHYWCYVLTDWPPRSNSQSNIHNYWNIS